MSSHSSQIGLLVLSIVKKHKVFVKMLLDELKELIRTVIRGEWSVTGLQEAIGDV